MRVEATDQCEVRVLHPEVVKDARDQLLNDSTYVDLAETFSALADSSRVKMICALMHHELCVCDIAAVAGISESAASQHLRILRNLRWVRNHRSGRMIFYTLEDQHVRVLLELSLAHAKGR